MTPLRRIAFIATPRSVLAIGAFALIAPTSADAAERTWKNFLGTPDVLWSEAANWQENLAPTAGDVTLSLKFGGSGLDPYVSENDITGLRLNVLTLDRAIGTETSIVGKPLDFRTNGGQTPVLNQAGGGAFAIDTDMVATNVIDLNGVSGSGLVTLNGVISGTGVRFNGGLWRVTNALNSVTGNFIVRDNATVELAPVGLPSQGVDLTPSPLSIIGNPSATGLTINGGTLKLTTAGFGGISLSAARRIVINANGGTLDLTNVNAIDPTAQGGNILAGDLALNLNNTTAPAVIRFNGGQLGLSQNSATDGNWNANGNTLRTSLLVGGGALRVELDNGAYYSASVAPSGLLTVRGKLGGDPTSGPTASINTGIGTNFGRFGIDANTLGYTGGLRFEDAVEVSIPGASRQITGDITVAGTASGHPGYVAFSGRATGTANQLTSELSLPGGGGPGQNVLYVGSTPVNGDTLTIETGGTAVLDARVRIEQAVNHGVLLNSETVIQPGATLRFGQSMSNFNFVAAGLANAQVNANVGDIIVRGRIVGQGTTTSESVVDVQLPAPVAGGAAGIPELLTAVPVATGARPFGGLRLVDKGDADALSGTNQDLVIDGNGFGGLKITATARPSSLFIGGESDPVANDVKLASVLTAARLSRVSGGGGYLTPAPVGAMFAFPAGGMWNDKDVGLRVIDHNPTGIDVSLSALTSWNRDLVVDPGATLDLAVASPFVFDSGTLQGKGTLTTSGTILISKDASVLPGLGDVGTLNLQGNLELLGGLTLDVTPSTGDMLAVTGNVSLGGQLTLAGSLGISDLMLARYTGNLTGAFSSVCGLNPDFRVDYGSGKDSAVKLVYSPQPTLVWSGTGSTWDMISPSWQGGALFAQRNKVMFDDTAQGAAPILTIGAGGVAPGLVLVNNSTRNYTIVSTPGASLGGTAQLIKNGSRILSLSGPATYTGGTVVNAGELHLETDNALPDVGSVTVGSQAILDMRGNSDVIGDLTVDGTVQGQNGSLTVPSLVLGSGAVFLPRLVLNGNLTKRGNNPATLANTIDLNGAARSFIVESGAASPELTISGAISGGALVKSGSGTLLLSGSNSLSDIAVEGGLLRAGSALAISAGAEVVISPGATLDLNGFASSLGALYAGGTVLLGDSNLAVTSAAGGGSLNLGSKSLSINQSVDSGLSAAITGSGMVIKAGPGTLRLSGASTFSGGVTVGGGILSIGAPTAAGAGSISVSAGGAVDLATTIANVVMLNGGTLGSSAGGIYAGRVQITVPSTLIAADPKDPGIESDLFVNGALQGTADLTIRGGTRVSGADGGAGVRLRSTTGTSYSGTITVMPSTKFELQMAAANSISPVGTGKIVLTAGTSPGNRLGTYSQLNLRNDGTGESAPGNDLSLAGLGSANLNPIGAAPSGSITRLGTLRIGEGQTLGVNKNDSTVNYGVEFSKVTLTGGVATFAPNTIGMGYTGTADLILDAITEAATGSGIRMDGAGGLYLAGVNSYTGPTILTAGYTYLGAEGALPASTELTMAGGVLEFAYPGRLAFSQTIRSLSGSAGTINNTDFSHPRTLTIDQAVDSSFDGLLSGALALIKQGAGKLTLTGVSSYSESTSVNNGTLEVVGAISGVGVTVGISGTLAGTGTIDSPVLINGTLEPGVSGPGTLMMGGENLVLGSASQTLLEIAGTNPLSQLDRVVGIGALTLDGTVKLTLTGGFSPAQGDTFDFFDAATISAASFNPSTDMVLPSLGNGLAWNVSAFTTTGVVAVIPEPGSAQMLVGGGATVLGLVRRNRRGI